MRPIPAANAEQAFFRLDVLRSLQLHRRLALGIALAGLALAVVYFFGMWPVYLAESVVYVQPAPSKVIDQGGAARWPFDSNTYESYIQQQMMNVTGTDVLTGALHKLGPGIWRGKSESEQAAVERLRRSIEVTREGASYQFSIGVHASKPAIAAQLANAVTASYIERASGEQKAGDAQRLAMLHEERERVQKELTADRAEQEALNKQLGQAAIGTATPDHYDDDITRIRAELVKARADHDEAAARFTSMGAGNGPSSKSLDAAADEVVASDAGLVSMKTSLNGRRAALITQMANLTPNHPLYKQDEAELAQINASLESMMNDLRAKAAERIQLRLRADLERTAAVEAHLNAQLGQLTGAAGGATSKLQRSSDLVADIARLQTRFTAVDEQWRNLMLEDGAPGAAFLSTPAVAPLHPAKSGVLRNAVLIAFAGLLFGILAAVAARKMDPKVYIAADVEQILGFAPMAQLPDFDEVSDGVADEYLLRLSAAIEHARQQGNLKNCIFTGTGPGTGVTTVVTRVREMLEAMGRATLLVDASGTPPPAPRANAAESGQPGGQPGGQALITTQRGSRSTALLQQMAEETGTQEASLVLTDAAPLVVSAETEYLARFVDCAIVVIESGATTRTQLREVASTLQRLDVAAVGFVLNRVGLKKADPAFRLSVRAIEDHLDAQNRSLSRRTVRSQPYAAEASPAAGQYSEGTAANAPAEPAAPKPVAEAASLATSQAVPEQLFVPAKPATPKPVTEATSLATPQVVPEQLFVPAELVVPKPVAEATSLPTLQAVPEQLFVPAEPVVPKPVAEAVSLPTLQAVPEQLFVPAEPVVPKPVAEATSLPTPQAVPEQLFVPAEPIAPKPVAEAASRPTPRVVAEQLFMQAEPAAPKRVAEATSLPTPQAVPEQLFVPAEPVAPKPVAEATSRSTSPVVPKRLLVPTEPSPVPPRASRMPQVQGSKPQVQESIQPLPKPVEDLPWWLADLFPQPDASATAALPQPEEVREPQPAVTAPRPVPAEPERQAEQPPMQHWVLPAQSWERVPSIHDIAKAEAATEAPREPEPEEASSHPASRLGGLRNLLSGLGMKNLRKKKAEQGEPDAEPVREPDQGTERTVYAQTVAPAPNTVTVTGTSAAGASPSLVTAQPEFLPPGPPVETTDKENSRESSFVTYRDRPDVYDGVQILPSRRGQYKRR
jgi:uncharacterized protein involved in exopolysaccharide biosynthesis/Mrp family chromosome partitioning ATPase